jgi:hypothetical protein
VPLHRPASLTATALNAAAVGLLFAGALVAPVLAQEALDLGASSFQFLKLPLSPRATAMGGAGAALAEGAGEAEINPAAAASRPGALTLGQEYPPQQFGTSASHISWNLPWGPRNVMLHTRYLGFDKIPGWDADNNATTPYEAHTLKLQAGMAGRNLGLDWGGSAAYARNNIASATYSALLVNAGLRKAELPLPIAGFSAGASMMNAALWAAKTKETGETVEPPLIWQAGLGYGRTLRPGSRASVALDVRKVADEDAVYPVGAEYQFMDALFVRAGYPLGDADNSFGLGLGLRWSRFAFNYAYRHHTTLSGGHGWTLEVRDL